MFSTVFGVPAHPLFVHAAVVFIPLLALFAAAYALLPRWRGRTGWLAAILAAVGPLAALFAKLSGDKFISYRFPQGAPANVLHHRSLGTATFWFTLGLGLATALMLWALQDSPNHPRPAWVKGGLRALVLVLAVIAVVEVARTGDSGAAAVWGRA
ncbi:DUF2231 domain-containing protein [Hamadaea tsunoensis]|uniref:DUF2231 domain-containing protein n=1 Tax=Hamadaea tsunoensis TaxID=53368 RepID=UPI0003F4D061|nr:DUF2231 domain-containing protein [Hamadaea tsunoensis]